MGMKHGANQVVEHYKGGFYTILFYAKNRTNNAREDQRVIVYFSHSSGEVYTRDENEFWENIRVAKHDEDGKPYVAEVPRFKHICWVNE